MGMTTAYPSKKAKRKAEALARQEKRRKERERFQNSDEGKTMEEMAAKLGIKLD